MTPSDTLANSIRAGVRFIYLISQDEFRTHRAIASICGASKFDSFIWSYSEGMMRMTIDADSKLHKLVPGGTQKAAATPVDALTYVAKEMAATNPSMPTSKGMPADGSVFVLQDFHYAMHQNATIIGAIKNIINYGFNPTKSCSIIVLANTKRIPAELEHMTKIIDMDLLSVDEIMEELCRYAEYVGKLSAKWDNPVQYSADEIEELARSAIGMSEYDLNVMIMELSTLHREKKINPQEVVEYKKNCIARSEGLEYYDCVEGLDAVGGLELLKDWLKSRKSAFTKEAKEFGLPTPKGFLMLGVPGCGKSLVCKTIAKEWNLPIVRLDIGKMMGGLVGTSEANIRHALKLAERISPCILWADELEKALSGVKSSSQTDGGTIARVFSTFITWLQDKTAPVFVIATANSVAELPPELLRKGRFDETWFVDIPNEDERKEIFRIHLQKRGRDVSKFNLDALARQTKGFVGSEIEECILSAMYSVFADSKGKSDIDNLSISRAIVSTIPLSKMQEDKIEPLRAWASSHARLASK